MRSAPVADEVVVPRECLATFEARERLRVRRLLVASQRRPRRRHLVAAVATVAAVNLLVTFEVLGGGERLRALGTRVRQHAGVFEGVLLQQVPLREGELATIARVLFLRRRHRHVVAWRAVEAALVVSARVLALEDDGAARLRALDAGGRVAVADVALQDFRVRVDFAAVRTLVRPGGGLDVVTRKVELKFFGPVERLRARRALQVVRRRWWWRHGFEGWRRICSSSEAQQL